MKTPSAIVAVDALVLERVVNPLRVAVVVAEIVAPRSDVVKV